MEISHFQHFMAFQFTYSILNFKSACIKDTKIDSKCSLDSYRYDECAFVCILKHQVTVMYKAFYVN